MRLAVLSLAAAICLASSPVPAAAQPATVQLLTEREAIGRLMTADPTLRALAARVDEVRALQAERALYPNPSITYSRESVFETHDTFLLARQELPVSGRRRQLQTAGRIAVEAAEAEAQFRAIELQGDLRDAYTDLLLSQEREAALKGAIDGMHKLIAVLRTREEAGEGSTYDRMRGQRALADLDADLALAAADRARAQGQLAGYLGPNVLPDTLVAGDRLDADTPAPPLPALLEQALLNRGDYRFAELSVAQFEAERRAALALRIPTPTLTGGLKRSSTSAVSSSGYQFSFDVSLPLFSRGQAATSLASAQKARAEAQAAMWRARIEAHVRATHTALTIHQLRVVRYRESAGTIAEALARTGRIAYEEGELGILELLDAERQALDARLRALELAADARQAAIELDRAIGREIRP